MGKGSLLTLSIHVFVCGRQALAVRASGLASLSGSKRRPHIAALASFDEPDRPLPQFGRLLALENPPREPLVLELIQSRLKNLNLNTERMQIALAGVDSHV